MTRNVVPHVTQLGFWRWRWMLLWEWEDGVSASAPSPAVEHRLDVYPFATDVVGHPCSGMERTRRRAKKAAERHLAQHRTTHTAIRP